MIVNTGNRIFKKSISFCGLMMLFCFSCLEIAAQGVTIESGLNLVSSGQINLVIDNGGMKNDGVFVPANSTVIFSGAGGTAISGSQPTSFYNLTCQGTGTKINAGTASVIKTLSVQGTTILDADGTANDKSFTLKSSDTVTANLDILTSGDVTGNVTVERYIHTGTGAGQHGKTWQLLATPTTGQTYFQAWQEGGTAPIGYGTWITGTGTGFDALTALPSLKYFDQSAVNWIAVTNTGNPLQNKLGYMLFVRGDRNVTTYNGTPNTTNMRSKGVLFTPGNPPPTVPVTANQFQTFGNPYASRIEFNKVYLANSSIRDAFYVWDPKMSGYYGLGGYQTITGIAGYVPSAGSPTTYYPAGVPSPYIESGQAVFVQGNGSGGTIGFNENCKASGSRLTNRPAMASGNFLPAQRSFLFTSLFTQTGLIADGNIVAFETGFGNEVNDYDAKKLFNPGENFGLNRDNMLLAVEARNPIVLTDTLFYHIQNLRQQPYRFCFAPVNIPAGITAYLVDKFQNSSTTVDLTDSTFIDFNITADAASNSADRFMLVFRQSGVVPVFIVKISAARQPAGNILVNWTVANEERIQQYNIERSGNGVDFISIGHTMPVANNGGRADYGFNDTHPLDGTNFYRIRAVSQDGRLQYSSIARVDAGKNIPGISVYPNPVSDNTINLAFVNQPKGNYSILLTNKLAQVIYKDLVQVVQPNTFFSIRPSATLPVGTYQLAIISEGGEKQVLQVVVSE